MDQLPDLMVWWLRDGLFDSKKSARRLQYIKPCGHSAARFSETGKKCATDIAVRTRGQAVQPGRRVLEHIGRTRAHQRRNEQARVLEQGACRRPTQSLQSLLRICTSVRKHDILVHKSIGSCVGPQASEPRACLSALTNLYRASRLRQSVPQISKHRTCPHVFTRQ